MSTHFILALCDRRITLCLNQSSWCSFTKVFEPLSGSSSSSVLSVGRVYLLKSKLFELSPKPYSRRVVLVLGSGRLPPGTVLLWYEVDSNDQPPHSLWHIFALTVSNWAHVQVLCCDCQTEKRRIANLEGVGLQNTLPLFWRQSLYC